jgi:hypothetical protein
MPGEIDASGRKGGGCRLGRCWPARLLFIESRWSGGRQKASRWQEEVSSVECVVGVSNN